MRHTIFCIYDLPFWYFPSLQQGNYVFSLSRSLCVCVCVCVYMLVCVCVCVCVCKIVQTRLKVTRQMAVSTHLLLSYY